MKIIPPFLKKGDKIAITCPAGAVDKTEMLDAIDTLEENGFEVIIGNTIGSQYFKFSAIDLDRKKEFQKYINDSEIKAILCGRGGYGVVRIIDEIDFSLFEKNPKWIIGYSDITNFHNHLNTNVGVASIHAHMLKGFMKNYKIDDIVARWLDTVKGTEKKIEWSGKVYKYQNQIEGELVGGNLAILSDLCGTNSDINTTNKILVIEDVSEYMYNIDRMMYQLKKANKLNQLKALIIGTFTDIQDNEIPFGQSINEIILDICKDYSFPIFFDFPFGHQALNIPLVLGSDYTLNYENENIFLERNKDFIQI